MSTDDTPTGPYWREDLPLHLRDHTFFRNTPTRAEGQALFEQYFVELYPDGKNTAHADREGARLLQTSQTLADRARAYADSLLSAVSPAQRLEFASAPDKEARTPHGEFDARFPKLVPERHHPYLGIVRGFSERAQEMGRGAAWGVIVKNELLLVALVNGEVPVKSAVDGRKRFVNEDDNLIAASMFKPLWDANEIALAESEAKGITRTFEVVPSQLQSPKAELLRRIFHAMTMAKTGRKPQNLQTLVKVFGSVIEAAKKEIPS